MVELSGNVNNKALHLKNAFNSVNTNSRENKSFQCVICKGNHLIYRCQKFAKFNVISATENTILYYIITQITIIPQTEPILVLIPTEIEHFPTKLMLQLIAMLIIDQIQFPQLLVIQSLCT